MIFNEHVKEFLRQCGWDAFYDYCIENQTNRFKEMKPILIDEMSKLNPEEMKQVKQLIKDMEDSSVSYRHVGDNINV